MKPYRYNKETKEVHRVVSLKKLCHAGTESYFARTEQWRECGQFKALLLIIFCGYDGCAHCYPEKHRR